MPETPETQPLSVPVPVAPMLAPAPEVCCIMMNIIMMSDESEPLAELEESDVDEVPSVESVEDERRLVRVSNSELPDDPSVDWEDWLEPMNPVPATATRYWRMRKRRCPRTWDNS